jgi:hypothetical protein
MSITITGLIERDARYARRLDGSAVVVVAVHACFGHPFEATVEFHDDHVRADNTARRIRRGMTATVTADSVGHRLDHGSAAYQLGRLSLCEVETNEGEKILLVGGGR